MRNAMTDADKLLRRADFINAASVVLGNKNFTLYFTDIY